MRIEQFVPQHEVLGRCRAVVSHGGSGTLVAALSLGVPVVVLPMGADQPDNADRCADARRRRGARSPDRRRRREIADAVAAVLGDDRYARAAGELAAEAAAQPRLADVPELRPPAGAVTAREARLVAPMAHQSPRGDGARAGRRG